MSTPMAVVFQRANQPDPRVHLAVDRLLCAQRLWEYGPADLHHIIHREHALCDASWLEGLQADLTWLQQEESDVQPTIDPTDLTLLFDHWQQVPQLWQKRVKRGFR